MKHTAKHFLLINDEELLQKFIDNMEGEYLNIVAERAATVEAMQDRIDALETMLASLLDAIENAHLIDYPVDEARALLEKE